MIIDKILDRKDNTYTKIENGDCIRVEYTPKQFYNDMVEYGGYGDDIASAMDCGEEIDVKRELNKYIIEEEYNPKICEYINSINWL